MILMHFVKGAREFVILVVDETREDVIATAEEDGYELSDEVTVDDHDFMTWPTDRPLDA